MIPGVARLFPPDHLQPGSVHQPQQLAGRPQMPGLIQIAASADSGDDRQKNIIEISLD
jgi:hypothetical protein